MKVMYPFADSGLKSAPRFIFGILYLVIPAMILIIFSDWTVEEPSEPSVLTLAVGIPIWLLNFAAIIYYTVLPDMALRRLHRHGSRVLAEVIECKYLSSGTLLQLRFTNLAGTNMVTCIETRLTGPAQRRDEQLQLQQHGHRQVVPLWLNTRVKQPAFGLAYQNGSRSWPELRLGLVLIAVTLGLFVSPAALAVMREPLLGQDFAQLVSATALWPILPLVNLAMLGMYFSHAAGDLGPTKHPVELFHLAGIAAQTESFHWDRGGYSGEMPVYKITLRYRDAAGQLHETRFSATGRATRKQDEPEEEEQLRRMPQQRPILYLAQQKEHILFRDHASGMFM